MPIPQILTHYLSQSSWQHLKALLAAHHLPRAAADAKATLIPVLSQHLVQPATLATMITQVDAFGKDALRAGCISNVGQVFSSSIQKVEALGEDSGTNGQ